MAFILTTVSVETPQTEKLLHLQKKTMWKMEEQMHK